MGMCRKDWGDKSATLGNKIVISMHAGKLSEETLRRARALYDLLFSANGATQRPRSPVRAGITAGTGGDARATGYAKGQTQTKGHGKHQVLQVCRSFTGILFLRYAVCTGGRETK